MSDSVDLGNVSAPAEATPSAPAPAAATPSANASPVASPQGTPAQATQSTPQAPEGWVPSYRIRESREAAQREFQQELARRDAAARSELDRLQNQIRALTGVQTPQNPEVKAVRDQFGNLYPGLSKLEEKAAQLEALLDRAGDLEQQNAHYWETYGRQSMDRLFKQAESTLGSPLSEEGKRILHSAFTGIVSSSPELSQRYATDPSLVEEFAKSFTSSFVDPVRRASSATVAGRAAAIANLPQDSPGGAPRVPGAPKPANLDERADTAWARYQQLAKG